MSQSFGDVWRLVRLHCPQAPFALVRDWTQQAYELLCERRPWVWTMKETRLATLASRSFTVTFTQGSTAITSAALFLATDVGRQIRVGTFPIYTIVEVASTSAATLDLAYAASGGALTASILSAYVTMPADFGAFLVVADPVNQRQIGWWYTQEDLGRWDPTRILSGDPQRALVAQTLSPVPATLGYSRYEWWPLPTSARQYPTWYRTRPTQLLDTDQFVGVLAHRARVLEAGALARCALWPGTADYKNPYFSQATYKLLADEFDRECAKLELRDDDQAQQSWSTLPYHRWAAYGLPEDTESLRASDATTADYY